MNEIRLIGMILLALGIVTYFFSGKIAVLLSKIWLSFFENSPFLFKKEWIKADINNNKNIEICGIINIGQGLFLIVLFYMLKLFS